VKVVLWVAAGGAIGAVARYLVTLGLARWGPLPWGTLVVNVVGSFVLGALLEAAARDPRIPLEAKALIGTGFCGGLTTFSTFSVETLRLPPGAALANVGANLGLALGSAGAGILIIRWLHPGSAGG
jgi:fluoride exporter